MIAEADRGQLVGGASRIMPRLWMGAHPPLGFDVARAGFTHLFICAWERTGTPHDYPGVVVTRVHLDDSGMPMQDHERISAVGSGRQVARLHHAGARILVTCSEGRNRSGLVVALALCNLGLTPETAIRWVRERRAPQLPANRPPLVNDDFVTFIRDPRGVLGPRIGPPQKATAR